MVSTWGQYPWMATTGEVRCIASLPTSLDLTGTVCIDGAMDLQQYPAAAGGWMATQCLMFSVITIAPVAVGQPLRYSKCDANPSIDSVGIKGVCWKILLRLPPRVPICWVGRKSCQDPQS
jgi:hypothetical protein